MASHRTNRCPSIHRDSKSLLGYPPLASEMICETVPVSTWNMLSRFFWEDYAKKIPGLNDGYKEMTKTSLRIERERREKEEIKDRERERDGQREQTDGVVSDGQTTTSVTDSNSNSAAAGPSGTSSSSSNSTRSPQIGHQALLWMKGPLCPQNIFLRTLDTGRLLPLSRSIGDVKNPDAWYDAGSNAAAQGKQAGVTMKTQVKLWMHKNLVLRCGLDNTPQGKREREKMVQLTLFPVIHELHYLNSLNEYPPHTTDLTSSMTSSDIHVIMGDFSDEAILQAGEYFQLMSKTFIADMKVKEIKEGKGKQREGRQQRSLKDLEREAQTLLNSLRAKEHSLLHYFRSTEHLSPCFPQLDLTFRSILYSHLHRDPFSRYPLPTAPPHFPKYPLDFNSDASLGEGAHPPPFVILYTTRLNVQSPEDPSKIKKNYGRPVFTSPRWIPDYRILKNWPANCASPECAEGNECDVVRLPRTEKEVRWGEMTPMEWAASWEAAGYGPNGPDGEEIPALGNGDDVIGEGEKRKGRAMLCNFIWCPKTGGPPLELGYSKPDGKVEKKEDKKLCTRCKRVVYCSQECQKIDWATHKRVCALEPQWK